MVVCASTVPGAGGGAPTGPPLPFREGARPAQPPQSGARGPLGARVCIRGEPRVREADQEPHTARAKWQAARPAFSWARHLYAPHVDVSCTTGRRVEAICTASTLSTAVFVDRRRRHRRRRRAHRRVPPRLGRRHTTAVGVGPTKSQTAGVGAGNGRRPDRPATATERPLRAPPSRALQ